MTLTANDWREVLKLGLSYSANWKVVRCRPALGSSGYGEQRRAC
jgi:hypothetical protein